VSGWEFVYLLTVLVAGLFVGATVYDKAWNGAARLTHWKHLQHGLVVLLIGLGFGGLAALAARVDSPLLRWFTLVGVLGSITYGALHQHAALRGKSR